jgi:hypothetical protein
MHCRLKVERPDDIQFTLTITMKASEWGKLRDQLEASSLGQSYPSLTLKRIITDLLTQARTSYWPTKPPPDQPAARGARSGWMDRWNTKSSCADGTMKYLKNTWINTSPSGS